MAWSSSQMVFTVPTFFSPTRGADVARENFADVFACWVHLNKRPLRQFFQSGM